MIPMQPKDIALAPLYLYQGRKLKRTALRLPEADGERHGHLTLSNTTASENDTLNLMLVGDSSAAGVGVGMQQQALVGHLLNELQDSGPLQQKFAAIDWALHATSGHTSFDVLRRLYILPKPSTDLDVMIVMVGVNDTTTNVSIKQWRTQLKEIIELSQRKFGAKHIIFPCLPPMQNMPAIPSPLNKFLGAKIDLMNEHLLDVCTKYDNVLALPIEFRNTGLSAEALFAEDGFHPNTTAYAFLAAKLAKNIVTLV